MTSAERPASEDDLWQEFASAFGNATRPADEIEPERETQDADGKSVDSVESGDKIDAEEILKALTAMQPGLPAVQLPPAPGNKSTRSLVSVPPMTVRPDGSEPVDSGDCLEWRLMGPATVGEKNLMALRLRFPSFEGRCDLSVRSDLLNEPACSSVQISRGLTFEADAVRFVPSVSGVEQLDFELRFFSPEGVPVECLYGKCTVRIRANETSGILNAGGDIIVVGKSLPGMQSNSADADDDHQLHWNPVQLLQDPKFPALRLRMCPEPDLNAPDTTRLGLSPLNTSGVAYTRAGSDIICWAVVVGDRASVGRGGVPETAWWIRPVMRNPTQFSKISRRHFTIDLRAGHAWITDHSANGTFLNGNKLNLEQRTIIADGDKVELQGSLTFCVQLFSDAAGVAQVCLQRNDELRNKFVLIVSRPGSLCRFTAGETGIWCGWKENQSVALNDGSSDWKNVRTGETVRTPTKIDFAWHHMPGSIDQDQLFPNKP